MKLAFSHYEDLVSADCQVIIDCRVEWENRHPILRVDNVFDTTGKVSLFRDNDPFWREFAGRIADEAEKCPRLLARAVEQALDEREAA